LSKEIGLLSADTVELRLMVLPGPFFLNGFLIQARCDGVGLAGDNAKRLSSASTISSPRLFSTAALLLRRRIRRMESPTPTASAMYDAKSPTIWTGR
jgi:hypothetical protein